MKKGYVYIITNKNNTVFYTGVTSNLTERIYQHKTGIGSFFTSKYNLRKLVWFDEYPGIRDAIEREKQIKNWRKSWKINLIKELNPTMRDLYDEIS
ncbi:MAG: GIY-YIG nuclease family protein [Balneolaceae bacterium]